jgi:hypothetical protein
MQRKLCSLNTETASAAPILHVSSESSKRKAQGKTLEVRNRKPHEPLPQPQSNYLTRPRAPEIVHTTNFFLRPDKSAPIYQCALQKQFDDRKLYILREFKSLNNQRS